MGELLLEPLEPCIMDPRDIPDHEDGTLTCGACGTFPEAWPADAWKCRRRGGAIVERKDRACARWRERPEPPPVDWEAMKLNAEILSIALAPRPERDWLQLHYSTKLSAAIPATIKSAGCSVYFIDCGPYTKIGITFGIRNRVSGLECSNPFTLRLWGMIEGDGRLEKQLHHDLAAYRHRNEWFEFDAEAREAIVAWLKDSGGQIHD